MDTTDSHIEINDKVLIAGLYGADFMLINNKIAVVKEIIVASNHHSTHYIAKLLIEDKYVVPVGFEFIYKINDPYINIDEFIISMDNPFLYYVRNKHLVSMSESILFDEYGQMITLCGNRYGKNELFLIAGLN